MPAQERQAKFSAEHFESLSPRDRIESLLAFGEPPGQQRLTSQFVRECKLKSIDILSPKSAKAVFTFKVARFYCNATGNLHGGASSMIFDLCTSLPVMALGKKDFWLNAGVSRTLIVNYLRPAPEGMELVRSTDSAVILILRHARNSRQKSSHWGRISHTRVGC